MKKRETYERTHRTRPAGVGKVLSKTGNKLNLQLADGRVISSVGAFGSFSFEVDMFVTFNVKGGQYSVLQVAPYGF